MENTQTTIRIDRQVKEALIRRMKPQESYNKLLRRVFKVKK